MERVNGLNKRIFKSNLRKSLKDYKLLDYQPFFDAYCKALIKNIEEKKQYYIELTPYETKSGQYELVYGNR